MTVLELNFPAGRYHATPWGRHVNEGTVEWPPSPWRILRALMATWYLKAQGPEISEDCIRSLMNKLSVPPNFQLPSASASHTRHYMPFNEGKSQKTTKIFDTFIQLHETDSVLVAWNTTLSELELVALRTLAERMNYFGRAESLVEARVVDGISPIEVNATPLPDGAVPPENSELVRILSPMAAAHYEAWRGEFVIKNAPPAGEQKSSKKKPTGLTVPVDLFEALQADTGDLQSAGWNLPPGTTFVNYIRPDDAFSPAHRPRPQLSRKLPTTVRYSVVSTVAPRITQAISIGNRVHESLCKWSDQGNGRAAVFTGLDENGKPKSDHGHAHIFCEANGPRDSVTHITVWAEMGFDEGNCLALRRLNEVWGYGGHDLRLVLHGIGQPDDFPDCFLFRPSKAWHSATPFVSTRHAKMFRDGRPKIDPENGWQFGSAGHDLLRLLSLHPRGAGATVRQMAEHERPYKIGERSLRSLQFQTVRRDGTGSRGHANGAAFTIRFPEERNGPFALGYGSHFGLGLFVPIEDHE